MEHDVIERCLRLAIQRERLIQISYKRENKTNVITGIVRGIGKKLIIFDVNDEGEEITIPHINIKEIKFV
jgi:hypothetical protein